MYYMALCQDAGRSHVVSMYGLGFVVSRYVFDECGPSVKVPEIQVMTGCLWHLIDVVRRVRHRGRCCAAVGGCLSLHSLVVDIDHGSWAFKEEAKRGCTSSTAEAAPKISFAGSQGELSQFSRSKALSMSCRSSACSSPDGIPTCPRYTSAN